ncbi:nucleotide-binding protein [Amycolatopsis sp. A133]|nr:TIR domain-containing protein [Amycolatopsis sp. A133]MDQ7808414.1 nucleotide-binding protein [Amycolatopsis sp. A133]
MAEQSVVTRYHQDVEDRAREQLEEALDEAGFASRRGVEIGDRGPGTVLVLAAVLLGGGMAGMTAEIASVARGWLARQPSVVGGAKCCVELEDPESGLTVRITSDDPDRALRLLKSSWMAVPDEPIAWQGHAWGPGRGVADPRRVFVIHGRDRRLRRGMFDFLRALKLEPVEWADALKQTGKGAPYVGDVLDTVFADAFAVVVLLTPDDIAQLQPEHKDDDDDPDLRPAGQARPNVLFEAGMALALFTDRTIFVEIGRLRPFTDIGGRNVVKMDGEAKARTLLAQRLAMLGCPVDLQASTDWLASGDLHPPAKSTTPPPPAEKRPVDPGPHGGITSANGGAPHRNTGAALTLGNFSVKTSGLGGLEVHGEARSNRSDPVSGVLKATFFDENGKILGTATGFVNEVLPDEPKIFSLMSNDDIAEYHDFKVQVDAAF